MLLSISKSIICFICEERSEGENKLPKPVPDWTFRCFRDTVNSEEHKTFLFQYEYLVLDCAIYYIMLL